MDIGKVNIDKRIGNLCETDKQRLIRYFSALDPLVKSGSFIEVTGKDGDIWRWYFHGEVA